MYVERQCRLDAHRMDEVFARPSWDWADSGEITSIKQLLFNGMGSYFHISWIELHNSGKQTLPQVVSYPPRCSCREEPLKTTSMASLEIAFASSRPTARAAEVGKTLVTRVVLWFGRYFIGP